MKLLVILSSLLLATQNILAADIQLVEEMICIGTRYEPAGAERRVRPLQHLVHYQSLLSVKAKEGCQHAYTVGSSETYLEADEFIGQSDFNAASVIFGDDVSSNNFHAPFRKVIAGKEEFLVFASNGYNSDVTGFRVKPKYTDTTLLEHEFSVAAVSRSDAPSSPVYVYDCNMLATTKEQLLEKGQIINNTKSCNDDATPRN